MRQTTVDGVSYACPMYLVRAGGGWQVRVPGHATTLYSDVNYGGAAGAFKEAVAHRRDLAPISQQTRPVRTSEMKSKLHPTGVAGIILQRKVRQGRSIAEFGFLVTAPGAQAQSVYLGTENTWHSRWDARLAVAVEKRTAMVQRIERQVSVSRPRAVE